MTAATIRKPNGRRAREQGVAATLKPTAYGRAVLRAIDRMKAVGPWELGPKPSGRYFKR